MITNSTIAFWLLEKLDLNQELNFSDRKRLKAGEIESIAVDKIAQLKKEILATKFTGGIVWLALLIIGFHQLAVGFGILDPATTSLLSVRGEGILLILGVGAFGNMIRISKLEKKCIVFETAREIDSLLVRST